MDAFLGCRSSRSEVVRLLLQLDGGTVREVLQVAHDVGSECRPILSTGWAKSINPLLRHEVEGVHRLGNLGYQTGLFGASADDQRTGYVHDPVPTDEVAAECHRVCV